MARACRTARAPAPAWPPRRARQHTECAESRLLEPECLTYAPLDAIALRCLCSVPARHEYAQPRRPVRAALQVKGVAGEIPPRAAAQQPLEFGTARQPALRAEAVARTLAAP